MKDPLPLFQGSVGVPEVMQVDTGGLPMAVGSNADSQQIIHISRKDTSTAALLPAVFTSRAEEERWMQLLTALAEDKNKGEMAVPEPLLRLYHQMLSKQFDGSKKGSSARLHAAWLLAELVQLAVPGKADERPSGQAETEQGRCAVKSSAGNSDDVVVQTAEEEVCDTCREDSMRLRTSLDRTQEDTPLGTSLDRTQENKPLGTSLHGTQEDKPLGTSLDRIQKDKPLGHGSDEL